MQMNRKTEEGEYFFFLARPKVSGALACPETKKLLRAEQARKRAL